MSAPLGYPVVGPNANAGVTYGPQNVMMNPQIAAQIASYVQSGHPPGSQLDLSMGLPEGTSSLLYPGYLPSYLRNVPGAAAGGSSPLAGQTVQSLGWQQYVPASQQQYLPQTYAAVSPYQGVSAQQLPGIAYQQQYSQQAPLAPAGGAGGSTGLAYPAGGAGGNAQISSLMQQLQSLLGGGASGGAASNPLAQFESQLQSILGTAPAATTPASGLSSTATGYTAPMLPSSFDTAGLDPATVAGMNVFLKQYLPQIVGSTALQGLGQGAQAEAASLAGEQAFVPLVQADIANRQKQEALGLQGLGLQTSYNLGQEGLGLQGLQLQADVGQRQEALGLQGIQTALEGYGMQQAAGMDIANLGQQGFQNLLALFSPAALPRDVSLQQSAATQNEIARLSNLVQQYVLGPLGGAVVPTIGQTVSSSGGK